MDILDGLNDAQKQSVTTTSGPLLILAGAGSGKTKALTHRVAYLIAQEGIWPDQILAVTFTNKAAREMRQRLWKLLHAQQPAVGNGASRRLQGEEQTLELTSRVSAEGHAPPRSFMPWMGTFHGICVRLLRIDGEAVGVPRNFIIYDEDDRQGLIKQAMKQLSVGDKEIKPRAVSSAISNAKNELVTPDEFESTAQFPYQKTIAKIYQQYEAMRRQAGALDFDDLLIETVRLFREHSTVRAKWRDKFTHILIDEYQDTNAAQYALIKLLVNDQQNIAVVGDDWQCLPEGSMIETAKGHKSIERITTRDKVRAASGYGATQFFPVTARKKFPYDDELVEITTDSGKRLACTPNHLLFSKWGVTNAYFVYLMYARQYGYRIGIAKGTRFDGKKHDIGLRVRANQERADCMWVLAVCQTREEALYQEAVFSYQYGIPMTVFHAYANRSMQFSQHYIDALYRRIDTKERAARLMADQGLHVQYPHFLPQATTRGEVGRLSINLVLFGDKRTTVTSAWSASRISVNTTDKAKLAAFEQRGYAVRAGRAGTYRVELHNLDYGYLEQVAAQMEQEYGDQAQLCRYTFITGEKFAFMPASQIHPGMLLPVEIDGALMPDRVASVTRRHYKGFVYDLDVDKVHNYVTGGVAVHNSIYSWRGADFTNILNFERDFPGATVIKLEQNYRSTASILDAAHSVILKNTQRSDKKLWTAAGEGAPVRVHAVDDETAEAALVAEAIAAQVAIGARRYDDMAVLYRTNAQSAPLERAFMRYGVKYRIIGGVRFYDRKEVKDILAYLKLAVQPRDRMSFSRIVNVPTRGVGATSLEKFLAWQGSTGFDIIAALANVEQTSSLTPRAKKSLAQLGEILRSIQASLVNDAPAEVIEKLIKRTGYDTYILDDTPQAEDRQENLGALISDASAFASVDDFLEEAALLSSADSSADDNEVTLMTLHAAKGLEFPVVYMVGMEEGILPHARVYEAGPAELEEERRLCYVGMTRAREELHLTYAYSRITFGQRSYQPVSRFIADMGDQIMQATDASDRGATNHYAADEFDDFFPDEPFSDGDRVTSQAFGRGTVVDVDGLALTIEFDDGTTKRLNAEYARLEKV